MSKHLWPLLWAVLCGLSCFAFVNQIKRDASHLDMVITLAMIIVSVVFLCHDLLKESK